MSKKLLFIVNTPEFFLSHRLPIALAARDAGYDVHVATANGEAAIGIIDLGLKWHILPLTRKGTAAITELKCLINIYKLFKEVRPTIVHLVTIKPVIYAGIISRFLKIPTVAAISGLGTVYIGRTWWAKLRRFLIKDFYMFALKRSDIRVIFQNKDDRSTFVSIFNLDIDNTRLIPGSGVNLEEYAYELPPIGKPRITYASRLLKEKGAREFFKAAEILFERGVEASFVMAGSVDTGNPSSISVNRLSKWRKCNYISFVGQVSDVKKLFLDTHIVVLPSYREGLPRVLIEAAAMGRPVVTTNVAGCRDAIVDGKTGLLVPVRNAEALADAIEALIKEPKLRQNMAEAGRLLAEKKFDIKEVITKHLSIYDELVTMGLNS
jgi:glycosyltransferase involved in cell wall biosynthesis